MTKRQKTTTICSSMHCYNRAKITNDPFKPPFCTSCKRQKEKKMLFGKRKARKKK